MNGEDTRSAFSSLFDLYVPIAAGVFAAIVLLLVLIVIRDRARPGHEPWSGTSAPRLELVYVVALVLVSAFLLWRTFDTFTTTSSTVARAAPAPEAGPAGLTIRVIGAKWNWRFEYPGGVAQQGRGPQHLPMLVVPAGQPVRFRVTSVDVVHSFWIPEARIKYDANPGRVNVFSTVFDPSIDYKNDRCSEFCGQYHEQMRFTISVRPPAQFRAWLQGRQRLAAAA